MSTYPHKHFKNIRITALQFYSSQNELLSMTRLTNGVCKIKQIEQRCNTDCHYMS